MNTKKESWRQRKKRVAQQTQQINEESMLGLALDGCLIYALSGKYDERYHYRTLANGNVIVCKNPKQNVHGKSLDNAHKMKKVMALAKSEYHDPQKKLLWQAQFEFARKHHTTKSPTLWNYICSQLYHSIQST